jgi:DNA-binding transcriptional ArsR family regulator
MNKNYMRAVPKPWRGIGKVFVALGDEHRQRILLTFGRAEELTAGEIAAVSTLSRPAVSHHLKILREAGVLQSRKEGREIWYRVDKDLLTGSLGAVLNYIAQEV